MNLFKEIFKDLMPKKVVEKEVKPEVVLNQPLISYDELLCLISSAKRLKIGKYVENVGQMVISKLNLQYHEFSYKNLIYRFSSDDYSRSYQYFCVHTSEKPDIILASTKFNTVGFQDIQRLEAIRGEEVPHPYGKTHVNYENGYPIFRYFMIDRNAPLYAFSLFEQFDEVLSSNIENLRKEVEEGERKEIERHNEEYRLKRIEREKEEAERVSQMTDKCCQDMNELKSIFKSMQ